MRKNIYYLWKYSYPADINTRQFLADTTEYFLRGCLGEHGLHTELLLTRAKSGNKH